MSCFGPILKDKIIPGKWLLFRMEKEGGLEEKIFQVIFREGSLPYDSYYCSFMDVQGTLFAYLHRLKMLGDKFLPENCEVKWLSPKELDEKLGGRVKALRERSICLLKDRAQAHAFGEGFDPDIEGQILAIDQIREKYRLRLYPDTERQPPLEEMKW